MTSRYWILLTTLVVLAGGLFAQTFITPNLRLSITNPSVREGSVVEENVLLTLTGPFSAMTFLRAELGNITAKRKLTEIFGEMSIASEVAEGALAAVNPAPAKTFSFNAAGKDYFYLRLPKGSEIDDVDLAIKGLENVGSYPVSPALDIGDDDHVEWRFAGSLSNFGSFLMPRGLQEGNEAGVVNVLNREDYFCEVINLTNAKDFEVHAKYANGENVHGANLTAVIFSFSGSGNTVQAQGGANTCAMPEATNELSYRSCIIRFTTFIQGERLACVYNKNFGNGNLQQYRLARDDAPGGGYRCDRLQSGQTTCQSQIADFFIKVKPGIYAGALQREASVDEGRTEFVFERELRDYLRECMLIDAVNCLVPVSVISRSKGVLYLDDLKIRYQNRGSQFVETMLHDATGSAGFVSKVGTTDLMNGTNITLVIPLHTLGLVAPSVSSDRNMTLVVGLDPGPSVQATIQITRALGNATGNTSVGQTIDAYKDIISNILEQHSGLFSALGNKDKIDDALEELETIRGRWVTLMNSNRSEGQKASEAAEMMETATSLLKTMPRAVVVTKSVSDVITPSLEDVREDILSERDEQARQRVYELQSSLSVNGKAEAFEAVYFDDAKDEGTLISKQIAGADEGYFVEIIPATVATANEILFANEPEIVKQSGPFIARWPSSIGSIKYVVKDDVVESLNELKTIFVPSALPEEPRREPLAVCGDGECSVLEANGERVALEDRYSCPQDCKPRYPWSVPLIATLLILAIVLYVNFYKGKYSFNQVFNKGAAPAEKKEKTPFISKRDEEGIKGYIQASLSKGFNKQRITEALLVKGWTKEQIEYGFKQLRR